MSNTNPIGLFTLILALFLALAVLVPIFNIALSVTNPTSGTQDQSIFDGNNYLSILLNIVSICFWTFGLPAIFNIPLLVIRIIGMVSFYYIITPTK